MISTLRQKFYYAWRGMVPGTLFMLPLAWYSAPPDAPVSFWTVALALSAVGALAGFFGGAVLDKVERCGYQPDDEWELICLIFWTIVAGATGMSCGGVPLVLIFQQSWIKATVFGFTGGFLGMVGLLWLESLREPVGARHAARGGFLSSGTWATGWLALALIEVYVLWDLGSPQ